MERNSTISHSSQLDHYISQINTTFYMKWVLKVFMRNGTWPFNSFSEIYDKIL